MLRKIAQSTVHSPQSTVKELFLCLFSAGLLIFSFPNFNLWLFAWLAFVPLLFVLASKSKWKAFFLSYLTGIMFWLGAIYWLIHVTLPGMLILVLYLALYFGIFGLVISTVDCRLSTVDLLFIPSIWVLLEYIRSQLFTGFPWALLGYSQYLNLPIIQLADITGAWGVSFLVMMVNVLVYKVMGHRSWVMGKQQNILLAILLLFLSLGYGIYKLHLLPITYYLSPIKVSVIQGNIPQELKWEPGAKVYILERYFELTEKAASLRPDLIIWPEAASPGLLGEDNLVFQEISALSKRIKTPLLIGTVARDNEKYFNSALLLNVSGEIAGRYDKLHLVPFGEYIPLKKILPFLETIVPIGDITAGREYTIFKIPNPNGSTLLTISTERSRSAKSQIPDKSQSPNSKITNNFAVLICFEDLFPQISREFIKEGANFLVNITNDAWYKKTAAAYQHLQASVFRAVENRVFLVRSANTGVSGFISPDGRIISKVRDKFGRDIFIDGYDTQEIAIARDPHSFYTRYGEVFVAICFLFALYGIVRILLNR